MGLPRLLRASILLLVSLPFVCSVFRLVDRAFWTNGMGDWVDPYFINYLLEHWRHSLSTVSSPASPPMFYPAEGTLGYSHGLVLFAPFYLAVRPFVHPFQAYGLALLLVIETGIICLYVFFRRILALSFVESILLTAFFFTSQNAINGFVGVWSQRASGFLVPPILLLTFASARMPAGRRRTICAALSGLLATLMYTQDFYSAHFALLFAILSLVPAVFFVSPSLRARVTRVWQDEPSTAVRIVIAVALLLTAWTLFVLLTGGLSLKLLGLRIVSRDWRRPGLLAVVAIAAAAWLRGGTDVRLLLDRARPWWLPFTLGAAAGSAVFLFIYLGVFREHPAFPAAQLMNSLVHQRAPIWYSPREVLSLFSGYETFRTFKLVFVLALLAMVPRLGANARIRWSCGWALVVSAAVLLVPITIDGFSIWKTVFAPLPGFGVVRDPKRIAYLYELAAVIAIAVFLTRLPARSPLRIASGVLTLALLLTERNPTVFEFVRPNASYDRWVAAPIAIDPSCRSFFIARASADYDARSRDLPPLYAMDAMFVALNHSIPTLNGYSAWSPEQWPLQDPHSPGYLAGVGEWVARHRLTGVCALDLDRRTMTPWP